MNTDKKRQDICIYASLAAFFLFAVYILYLNREVLYTAHDRSEFLYGTPFFHALMSKPFGLMRYVGAWLTQLFCYPAVGASVLMAIWTLIFFVGTKAFRLEGNAKALMLLPVAFLLTSVVDLGYWIYVSTIRGYWFSQSVGYLVMLTLLWIAHITPRKWHLVWYIIAFCSYPVLGWFAILFVICLAIIEKPTWRELLGVVLILFAAGIWRTLLYSNMKSDDVTALAGMPRFITASDCSEHLTIPFWLLGAVSVIIPLCSRYLSKAFVPVACAVAGIAFTWSMMFRDSNYIDEMRMVRYAEDDKWQDVLDVVNENPKPTVSMVMLENVALMNKEAMHENSFKMRNDYSAIYNPDSLHVSFLEIASPVVYYNYGLLNEGFRLAFECAVQSGFSPFYLKALSRCAFANGEKALVDRYTAQLHGLPFYSDWQPAPVTENIRELHRAYPNELTGVENSISYLINSVVFWYEADSRIASEQALLYSMLRCDSRCFWPSLRQFVKQHEGETFPTHAQEAYILFMDKSPEKRRMKIPVSQEIYDRYQRFWSTIENHASRGKTLKEISEMICNDYGDTYWYYNIFGKKIR